MERVVGLDWNYWRVSLEYASRLLQKLLASAAPFYSMARYLLNNKVVVELIPNLQVPKGFNEGERYGCVNRARLGHRAHNHL